MNGKAALCSLDWGDGCLILNAVTKQAQNKSRGMRLDWGARLGGDRMHGSTGNGQNWSGAQWSSARMRHIAVDRGNPRRQFRGAQGASQNW